MGWVFPSANFAFWFKTSFSSVTLQLLLFTFHQEKKNQKRYINTFVKGTHCTSKTVCRQESPRPWPDLSLSPEPSHLHELLQWLLRPGLLQAGLQGGGEAAAEGGGRVEGPGGHSWEAWGRPAGCSRPRASAGRAGRQWPAGPGLRSALPAVLEDRARCSAGPLQAGQHTQALRGHTSTACHCAGPRSGPRRAFSAWWGAIPGAVGQLDPSSCGTPGKNSCGGLCDGWLGGP